MLRLTPAVRANLRQIAPEIKDSLQTKVEPIRTIHHFACTGGTVISKCLAALPNTQLLSEVDPYSTIMHDPSGKPTFAPADLITLSRQSTAGVDTEVLTEIFRSGVRVIYEDACRRGLRLIIRDHAHGQYCVKVKPNSRPSLLESLPSGLAARSIITVRHPVESYLSLLANNWAHFEPPTISEYARRYTAFLDSMLEVPMIRYEDFINDPIESMRSIAQHLDLRMADSFVDLFSAFRLTGDSGRTGTTLSTRKKKEQTRELEAEIDESEDLQQLLSRLGY